MSNPQDSISDFWYKFDDFFSFHKPPEIGEAIEIVQPYGRMLDSFKFYQRTHQIEEGFRRDFENIKLFIKTLADNIVRILDEFFRNNPTMEQNAFELFAQGTLFDNGLDLNGMPRRQSGEKFHMMDSAVVGYVAWHAFVRAVLILDLTDDKERWVRIDRNISLAAAILATEIKSHQKPEQSDDPQFNKALDPGQLKQLREFWLILTPEEIDDRIVQLQESVISNHA